MTPKPGTERAHTQLAKNPIQNPIQNLTKGKKTGE
jgi:hypothetical protein